MLYDFLMAYRNPRTLLRRAKRFLNPCGSADDRSPSERPLLHGSGVFTLLLACLVFLVTTGVTAGLAGMAGQEFLHYSALEMHLLLVPLATLLFLAVAANHLSSIFGARAGLKFLAVYIAGVALAVVIHLPIWQVFLALPLAVCLVLTLLFRKPVAQVERRALRSGRVAATAWWAFLFVSLGFHCTRETYYLGYPTLHVGLMLLALSALTYHVRQARRAAGPNPAPRLARAAGITVLLALVVVFARSSRNAGFFAPRTDLRGVSFPVSYKTSEVKAGQPLSPDPRPLFRPSQSCNAENCHPEIYRQWAISSHRYAALLKPYRKLVELVYDELGPEATLFCSKCHAPMLAMLGLPDDSDDPSLDRYRDEGISCHYCHAIREAGESGANGDFLVEVRMGHFQRYQPAGETGQNAVRSYMLNNLSRHRDVFPVRDPEEEEYCAGCHRVEMPPEFVGDRTLILGDLHTPYTKSRSAAERISCSECHMNLATYWGQALHARPDHRTPGTNNALSLMVRPPAPVEPDLAELDRTTESFLRGDYAIPGYEVLYLKLISNRKHEAFVRYLRDNPKVTLSIEAPEKVGAGAELPLEVRVENRTAAHPIPSGPIDLNEYWIELSVEAADGRKIFRSGEIGPDHHLPEDAVRFGGTPLDANGAPVENHRFWLTHSVRDRRSVPVDGSYNQPYTVPIPAGLAGRIVVKASLCYRRYNQKMADWIYDRDGTTFPVYRYDTASVSVEVSAP